MIILQLSGTSKKYSFADHSIFHRLFLLLVLLFFISHLNLAASHAENINPISSHQNVSESIEQDDPGTIHINGLGRVLKGDHIDVRVLIARNLIEVKKANMSPERFYLELAKMEMPSGMEPRHMLNQVKKDIFDYGGEKGREFFFGQLYPEGGSLVEKKLLEWRRDVVFEAVDEVMKKFQGRNEVNGKKFSAYLAEVGSWTTESLQEMRFAGDIDFSFVAGDIELSREMKAEYDKIIFDRLKMSAEHADVPCTAHGMASAEVYMGKHGQISGEGFMKMHPKGLLVLDFEKGRRTDNWESAEKALKKVVIEANVARLPLMEVNVKWKTEPGISLEMIRHFEHDIIHKNVYTDIDAFLKAAKYLQRSTSARYKDHHGMLTPLEDFAQELMKLKKKGSPVETTKFILDNFHRVTGKPFPDIKLGAANIGGLPKAQIDARDDAIRKFWDQCKDQMWKNTLAGFDKELVTVRRLMQDATDEESAKKAYNELYDLREMMEVEWRIITDAEVGIKSMPAEFKKMMQDFRGDVKAFHKRLGASDFGIKVMDVESQKVYRLVDQMLQRDTPDNPAGRQFAAAALLQAPHFVNNFLDFIDDRLMGKLRGQDMDMQSFLTKELELEWQRKAEKAFNIDRGTEAKISTHQENGRARMTRLNSQMTTAFSAKLTTGIQKINRSFDFQSSKTGRAAMTGLVAVNLAQEIPVYIDLFYREGVLEGNWDNLITEFFRRRVPFGSTSEYIYHGWYGMATWDFFVTLIPPLGLLNVAAHFSASTFTWSLDLYLSSELQFFLDTLYDDAIFAGTLEELSKSGEEGLAVSQSGAVVNNWVLHTLVYKGTKIEVSPYLKKKEKHVREFFDYLKKPLSQREIFPTELTLEDPLTSWTRADDVLRQNLAKLDPWLIMLDEMKKNPHVGEKLLDHLQDMWFARWEQIKLQFIRDTIKRMEERRAAEMAAGSGQLPLLTKKLNRISLDLMIIEQVNANMESEMGGIAYGFYRAIRDWFVGKKRVIYAQADIETHLVECTGIVKKYLDVYTKVHEARKKAEGEFVLTTTMDNGFRLLTGPYFLSGEPGKDASTYTRWEILPEQKKKAVTKELLAIKRKYKPDSSLDIAKDSFDQKIFRGIVYHDVWREIWMHVNSQGIVPEPEFKEISVEMFIGALVPKSGRADFDRIRAGLSESKPDPLERHRKHTLSRRAQVKRFEEFYRTGSDIGDEQEEKKSADTAYFKVLVQGSGYTFTYGDGTYKVSGSEERYIVVRRDQSASEILREFKKNIDGEPCERTFPSYVEGEVSAPGLFISGSKITIVDGPYYDFNEFFGSVKFKKDWQINGKNGPSPAEMAKRIKCQ